MIKTECGRKIQTHNVESAMKFEGGSIVVLDCMTRIKILRDYLFAAWRI